MKGRALVLGVGVSVCLAAAFSPYYWGSVHTRPQTSPSSSSSCCGGTGVGPRELVFPYYSLANGYKSQLLLVSDSPNPIDLTIVIRNLYGQTLLDSETIQPQAKLTIDLGSTIAKLGGDPTQAFAEGGVAVDYVGTIMPVVGQMTVTNAALCLTREVDMVENDPGRSDIPPVLNGLWWNTTAAMSDGISQTGTPMSIEARLAIAAHHEAGHIVIAIAAGLRLRPEGIMVDTEAEGLACYCKEPEDADESRARVILATFAGCFAQDRFCKERGYPELEYLARIWSLDWKEARGMATKFSDTYLLGRGIPAAHEALEQRSKELVAEKWSVIEAVANALLAKEWEAVKPLKSGGQWAKGASAKYLTGEEVIRSVEPFGITAPCVREC
jgi:hypothetical protein